MAKLNRLVLVLVCLLLFVTFAHAEPAGDLTLNGRAAFVARSGNNLTLGTEGANNILFRQNNATTFSVNGTTGAVTLGNQSFA